MSAGRKKKFCSDQHRALWHNRERTKAIERDVRRDVVAKVRALLDRLDE